jgi:arginyl-tRNA synthetase
MQDFSLHIFDQILQKVLISSFPKEGDMIKRLTIANNSNFEIPKNRSHGDLTSNFAMMNCKLLSKNPRDLANIIIKGFLEHQDQLFIKKIEIAGPGFLNIFLDKIFWQKALAQIFKNIQGYGFTNIGNGKNVNVEYVSANPTGPLHIGHCRGAVIGDVVASVYEKMGYQVTREYYVNDAGGQIDQLINSVNLKYQLKASLVTTINNDQITYNGEYIDSIVDELYEKYGDTLLQKVDFKQIIKIKSIEYILDLIKEDLAKVNIKHDLFFSEQSLIESSEVDTSMDLLKKKELIYIGKLPQPKNKPNQEIDERDQELFRSTLFGDDMDRAISKEDGSHTYFASDIAYHNNKYKRGFSKMINVWGADHSGYVKRIQGAVSALSNNTAKIDILLCQLVKLLRDNKPVKMSKRNNDYITIGEVVDEVGSDPIRFMMIFRKSDAPLDFDFVKVCEKSKENPVFYVQYAYARINSVFRNWSQSNNNNYLDYINYKSSNFDKLKHDSEIDLIKKISYFPKLLVNIIVTNDIHKIAYYLHELASDFHSLWNLGNDNQEMRFIIENKDITQQRLALLYIISQILETGLDLLGVSHPEQM